MIIFSLEKWITQVDYSEPVCVSGPWVWPGRTMVTWGQVSLLSYRAPLACSPGARCCG